jgi:homoserine acetyltransferase
MSLCSALCPYNREQLRAAKLAYKTYGPLDRDGGNVTLLLASFSRAFDKAAAKLLRS